MFKRIDIAPIVFILINMCYMFMLTTINMESVPYVQILLPIIFILAPAVYLNFGSALLVVAFSALMVEGLYTARAGMICAIWISAAAVAHSLRFRLRGMDIVSITVVAEFFNFCILLFYAFVLSNECSDLLSFGKRWLFDAGVSSLLLFVVAKFTMRLPADLLALIGRNLHISEESK